MERKAGKKRGKMTRNVVPDRLDLRDRIYLPAITRAPAKSLNAMSRFRLVPLDQGETSACTGFALSQVVNYLLRSAQRTVRGGVSPWMLYSMARRYDDFPGEEDAGSSLRGAMKGWYKHGSCRYSLWGDDHNVDMPPAAKKPKDDWWQEAVLRPLGAYYRVDPRSVTDMHVALSEVGVLYASAACHAGWDEGWDLSEAKQRGWRIPAQTAADSDGGHAFVIVGYDRHGFKVLNSWGKDWGDGGFATLAYGDWIENAMDCWVAQLGVVTEQHDAISKAVTLRRDAAGKAVLASGDVLRQREISPFIVNMANNGELSSGGLFRTGQGDLEALVTVHMAEARKRWQLGDAPMDVAVYAHGGLTGEKSAAETAMEWIPALYDSKIFPIFFMWETDLWTTLKNRLVDFLHGEPRATGGLRDTFLKFWNRRLERGLAAPGSMIWGEMKQNAAAISLEETSGARRLFALGTELAGIGPDAVRLHLIGHSAGSIVHCHLANALVGAGWQIHTVNFMAPAVGVDVFKRTMLGHLESGAVGRLNEFHLTDACEQSDPTCKPILGYGRSLLYLVSESFEGGKRTEILGMEKSFAKLMRGRDLPVNVFASPSQDATSTTHGGFDDDPVTRRKIVDLIQAG